MSDKASMGFVDSNIWLYSEDMQNGLVVDKSLTVINPFEI